MHGFLCKDRADFGGNMPDTTGWFSVIGDLVGL